MVTESAATAVTVPVSRFMRVVANGPCLASGAGEAGAGADGLGAGLVAAAAPRVLDKMPPATAPPATSTTALAIARRDRMRPRSGADDSSSGSGISGEVTDGLLLRGATARLRFHQASAPNLGNT